MSSLAILSAVLLGATLGLFGAGGSILALPTLVYLCGVSPVTATSYSLCIVGVTATLGAVRRARRGEVPLREAVLFGTPSVLGVLLARKVLLPRTPELLGQVGGIELTRDLVVVGLTALLMIVAGAMMVLRGRWKDAQAVPTDSPRGEATRDNPRNATPLGAALIVVEGLVIGVVTGFVGVGGGFLIVPTLVLAARLPVHRAIGASLAIIAAKSILGFTADLTTRPTVDWGFLVCFSLLSFAGMLVGERVANKTRPERLGRWFGALLIVIGAFILVTELV